MKKRLISVFVFALTVAAGAAFVLYQMISSKVTAGAATRHPANTTVWVAARDLVPGSLITEDDLVKQEYVTAPNGAIAKKEDIVNRGVISAIHRDSPFFDTTLALPGEGAGFATTIPPGMRAFTVRVDEVVGVAGFAVAGMHVDVLVAGSPPNTPATGAISRTLLQNITVLSAGQNYQKDAQGKPVVVQVVNLLLTPAQSEIMNLATEQRIQLVLRNPGDQVIAQTPGAATANLFEGNAIRTTPLAFSSGASEKPRRHEQLAAPPPPFPPAPAHVAQATSAPVEVLSGSNRAQVIVRKTPSADTAPATPAATEAK